MCFNAAFVPIIYFLYPETAGKTLEELDTLFHETTHAWKLTDKGSNPVPDLEAPMASGLSSDEDVSRKRASHSSIADEKL